MDRNKKIEIALPLFFILFSVYIVVTGLRLPNVEGYFPVMIGVLMMASSSAILIGALKKSGSVIALEKINVPNIVKAAVALAVYVFILPVAGYLVSTVLLGIFIIYALGFRDRLAMVLYPLIITGLLFFGFKVLLRVPLPAGWMGM